MQKGKFGQLGMIPTCLRSIVSKEPTSPHAMFALNHNQTAENGELERHLANCATHKWRHREGERDHS